MDPRIRAQFLGVSFETQNKGRGKPCWWMIYDLWFLVTWCLLPGDRSVMLPQLREVSSSASVTLASRLLYLSLTRENWNYSLLPWAPVQSPLLPPCPPTLTAQAARPPAPSSAASALHLLPQPCSRSAQLVGLDGPWVGAHRPRRAWVVLLIARRAGFLGLCQIPPAKHSLLAAGDVLS